MEDRAQNGGILGARRTEPSRPEMSTEMCKTPWCAKSTSRGCNITEAPTSYRRALLARRGGDGSRARRSGSWSSRAAFVLGVASLLYVGERSVLFSDAVDCGSDHSCTVFDDGSIKVRHLSQRTRCSKCVHSYVPVAVGPLQPVVSARFSVLLPRSAHLWHKYICIYSNRED